MDIEWKLHRDLQENHEMIKGLSAGEHGKELIRRGKKRAHKWESRCSVLTHSGAKLNDQPLDN